MSPAFQAAAIVLAGGKSTRLGRDKAGEPLLGVPLLQRVLDRFEGLVTERVVVKARGQTLPPLTTEGVQVVDDLYPGTGPLGGVYTGLSAIASPFALATGCDMPMLQPLLLAEMLRLAPGRDAVVPVYEGVPQPLCAVYAHACLGPMRRRLEAGALRLASVLESLQPLYLQPAEWRDFDPAGVSFLNVNSEEALKRAAELLAGAGQDTLGPGSSGGLPRPAELNHPSLAAPAASSRAPTGGAGSARAARRRRRPRPARGRRGPR
jgi:molybdopterin-guanine dinucleotide biosynthesis protein A